MSIFIHDCIECQQNKHINEKTQTATIQTFSENASYFNYRISMDTKGPINPPSKQNSYNHVIVDAFSHFVVTVPVKQNNAQTAVNYVLHHWITKFGLPIYLVKDRVSEYINSELANFCTTMGIRHSPRNPYAPWTNGLVKNQNKNLGTHIRLFLHNTPENWSTQVHMYAHAHNSQPLSELNHSPNEIVFHTTPRIPINFELNLQRDTCRNCTSQYCQDLPLHTHYDKSNSNSFFHKILSKPIPQWILATETAMIQIYHTSFQTLPEYTAYLNSDTDILDSSSANHSPSAPCSPDGATVTPNNTPILQTQTSVITTQSQNITTTQPQYTQQNLPFLETNSSTSDSCDESLTTQSNVQDTSSIKNRPPLPPVPTTRTPHIPDPSSVLQYVHSCPHRIRTATKTPRKTPIPTLPKNLALPSTSQTPIKTIPEHIVSSPSELSSFTFSQVYPRLELDRLQSNTTSSLTDLNYKNKDSDSFASTRVPRHSYNLRSQSRRNSQELQSLTSSCTNSRLVRQQAKPRSETLSLSSSHPTIPSSLSIPFQVTSGFETASFLSEDPQTISDSAANFSRVYSPSSILSDSSIQLPVFVLTQRLFVVLTKILDTLYSQKDL